MADIGWRRRRGSSPAARRGARQRAGLTAASASNTLSCERETLHQKPNQNTLTVITVSTEMALHVLAYNLTRVMNIVGIQPLMAAMRA